VILVAGATGVLGTEICRRLIASGQRVRALVRDTSSPAKVTRLTEAGAQIVVGDVTKPASIDRACDGVTAVVTTIATTISRQPYDSVEATELRGQIGLVDAAQRAGAQHFVYTSVSGGVTEEVPGAGPFIKARRTVEQHLQQSGLAYTILRPTPFMDIWLGPMLGFDYVGHTARVFGSGEARISWIGLEDVVEFAVQSLTQPGARDAILELGGPQALSMLEVINIFEQVGGQPFTPTFITEATLAAQLAAATDPYDQILTGLMTLLASGNAVDPTDALRAIPVQLTTVRQYAERVLSRAPVLA
jgi:uncharacterized protein YbjT (DUF2867 family)